MEINAITLVTRSMAEAIQFWTTVGLDLTYGGPDAPFTTLRMGTNFVNLQAQDGPRQTFWGRVVFHVDSPDELWTRLVEAGYTPMTEPADAPWGERYFHIKDPDGHELSFARPL